MFNFIIDIKWLTSISNGLLITNKPENSTKRFLGWLTTSLVVKYRASPFTLNLLSNVFYVSVLRKMKKLRVYKALESTKFYLSYCGFEKKNSYITRTLWKLILLNEINVTWEGCKSKKGADGNVVHTYKQLPWLHGNK